MESAKWLSLEDKFNNINASLRRGWMNHQFFIAIVIIDSCRVARLANTTTWMEKYPYKNARQL